MAATRENVLSAISQYVQDNKRRAPAKDIAVLVGDNVVAVQAIIKALVSEGVINSSRGRNGGALPDGVTLDKPAKALRVAKAVVNADPQPAVDSATADQFAALMAQLDRDDSSEIPAF